MTPRLPRMDREDVVDVLAAEFGRAQIVASTSRDRDAVNARRRVMAALLFAIREIDPGSATALERTLEGA